MENLTNYEIEYIKRLLKRDLEECTIEIETFKDEETLREAFEHKKNTISTILEKLGYKENEINTAFSTLDLKNLIKAIRFLGE